MNTLTFAVSAEIAEQLHIAAREMGVPIEDLLQKIAADFLSRKADFPSTAEYVLQKNAELYQRLAK
jgi:hypothetical protein